MGEAFLAVAPKCPVHGKMFESFERDRWVCHGFDGEGCDYIVNNEDIVWTRMNETEFRMGP